MKKQDVLNKREEELMNFLWAYNEPLTQNEMAEKLEEQGWSSVTLFKTVQGIYRWQVWKSQQKPMQES